MDTRRALAELLAGRKPRRPQAVDVIQPDWWQGGGPQEAPRPMLQPPGSVDIPGMPSSDAYDVPPSGTPSPYSMGTPPPDMGLSGRRRMRDIPDSGAPAPFTDEEKLMLEEMERNSKRLRGEQEFLRPRSYGRGQPI